MKKIVLALVAASCLWVCGAGAVLADTLNLQSLPSDMFQGYYVGPVSGNLNGGAQTGFVCDDFLTETYVPSSFPVQVSTLADISQTKFGGQPNALFKYQEVAWLLNQMNSNPTQVGPIQFAIWNVFTPSTPDPAGTQDWINAAASINPAEWDFSSMRIYTATTTRNQEFVGGGATSVPEPGLILLLGFGLAGLGMLEGRRRRWIV